MSLPRFEYRAPRSVAEAVALRTEFGDDALLLAGGLAAVILMRERLVRPRVVVSLSELPELRGIAANGGLTVGAMATHAAIARSEAVGAVAPILREACGRVGSPAIRNMGTLGGSVCHADAASDTVPALLALGGQAQVAGPQGERRIALDEFFVGTLTTALAGDEVLTALHVPRQAPGTRMRFVKFTATSEEAFSTVTVALAVTLDGAGTCTAARIGLGSVGPVPLRATAAEQALRGHRLTKEAIAAAAAAAMEDADPSSGSQGSAEYRREMTGVWVRRLLEDVAAP